MSSDFEDNNPTPSELPAGQPEEPTSQDPSAIEPQALPPVTEPVPPVQAPVEKKPTVKPAAEKAKTPAARVERKPERPRATFGSIMAALGVFVLEVILPVIIASGVMWLLFSYFHLWQTTDRTLALILFGVGVVALALLASGVVETLAAPLRKMVRARGARFTSTPVARLLKLMLGGLLIPLAVVIAANFVPLPNQGKTVMNLLAAASAAQPVVVAPPEEVGNIAMQATNPSTKLLSIQVLQGFRSPEALSQLIKLVNEDPAALSDPGVAGALSKSIAVYGVDAKGLLLTTFKAIDPAKSVAPANISSDLYDRYFAQSFDSLKNEITSTPLDSTGRDARLAQLQAAQAQLKQNLTAMQVTPSATAVGDPRLDFIIQTFLSMDLKQDADLLSFAKTTAIDARYSSAVRGDALLLIGKLGGKDDLNILYPYLKVSDSLLQTRALQAIAMLQTRLNAAPPAQP